VTATSRSEPLTFAPGAALTAAVALVLAGLLALGTWQVQRLAWKTALIEERTQQLAAPPTALPAQLGDPADWDFRRVRAAGRFLPEDAQLMGVSTQGGRLGRQLLVPLELDGGRALLVDRGWIPEERALPLDPALLAPDGAVEVTGILRDRSAAEPGWFTPANAPAERTWFWYDVPALSAATGRELLPVVLEADAGPGEAPPIGGLTLVDLPNDHLQYAITWYGLAAGLVAVYVAYGLRRGRTL
jgi:surfeit locus 1 family protein